MQRFCSWTQRDN